MFYIEKSFELSASHKLDLDYDSPCGNIHGHNWQITVCLKSEKLNNNGMIMDFSNIKKLVIEKLDHKHLNDSLNKNPTAENIAKFICDMVGDFCYRVKVAESTGNIAIYERDDMF